MFFSPTRSEMTKLFTKRTLGLHSVELSTSARQINCYTNRPIVVVSSSCTTKCFHTVQWWSYFPWTAHGVRLSNDYTAHCCTLPVLCAFTVFVWWYELRFQSCSSSRAMMVVFCSKYLLEIWSLNKFLCVYWYLFSCFFLLKSEIHFKNVFVDFLKMN